MSRIVNLTRRHCKEIVREPVSLFFMMCLPVAMEILFYLIFHKLTAQFEIAELAPGMVGFANTFIALFLGLLVSTDRESSFITRIYTTPVKPYEFIVSYLLAVLPFGIAQSALILLVGGIIAPVFLTVRLLLVLLCSLLPILMFASLGILLGSVLPTKAVGGVSSILISGQSLLSGMWFPLEGLSGTFIKVMDILPFRNITMLLRNIAARDPGGSSEGILLPAIVICAYTLVSAVLSCLLFLRNSRER